MSTASGSSGGTSAIDLLSILRGTGSQQASPAASTKQAASTLNSFSTAQSSNGHSESGGNSSDLDRLFKNAFGSGARHPSASTPAHESSSEQEDSERERREAMAANGSHAPRQSQPTYQGGAIERPVPSPTTAAPPKPFVFGSPGGFGGGVVGYQQQKQSANLLSLLQGMGAPAPPTITVPQQQEPESEKEQGDRKRTKVAAGQQEQAAGLLATLMGDQSGKKEPESVEQVKEPSPPPPPKFAPFVSPFDLLAQAHAAEQQAAKAASPRPASSGSRPSALPSHLTSDVASNAASSDSEDHAARAQSPIAPTTVSFSSLAAPSSPAQAEATRALLASQYLPSSPHPAPYWAPIGLRLPAPLPDEAQSLTIDLTLPHLDSLLLSSPVVHTPVTLFAIPPTFPGSVGQKVGIWSKGLVYATAGSKGRLRIIDRESGTRVLLKGGGKKEVIDLQVAQRQEGGKRVLASTTADGKLTVWRVEDSCTEETAGSEKLLDIQGHTFAAAAGPRFPLVRFHPRFPSTPILGLAVNDGRVFMLDLSQVLKNGAQPQSGEEALLHTLGKGAQCGSAIIDFAFSPDGSAFVVLTSDRSYSIRSTAAPTEVIRTAKLLDDASTPAAALTGISFVADKAAKPTALAVTSKRGTYVRIVPLARSAKSEKGDASISFLLPSSSDIAPSLHFSHHAYAQSSNILYLSSSLRGSLFAFRLAFSPRASVLSSSASDDATFFASSTLSEDVCDVKIEHVSEVPTEEPVLGFALDASQAALKSPKDWQDTMGALVMHPGGIHQVLFVQQKEASSAEAAEDPEEHGAGSRRMSLESSIHVSSEVEVVVDEADPMALEVKVGGAGMHGDTALETGPAESLTPSTRERRGSMSLNIKREPSITPIEEEPPTLPTPSGEQPIAPENDNSPTVDDEADASSTVPNATPLNNREIKLSGSAVNAAIRSMKAKNKPSSAASPDPSSPVSERVIKVESPSPAPALSLAEPQPQPPAVAQSPVASTSKSGDPIANAWATGVAPAKKSKKEEANAELLKELRKMDEGLPAKIAKLVGKELEKHAARAEEERANDQAADTARQETMLKLVSTTLAKSTSRLVESTIKDQIKQQVIPSINKLVSAAVQEQIGAGLAAGLKETLPDEMEKVLYRPEVTAHLARNFSSAIGPSLERSLLSVVAQGVVSPFKQLLAGAVEACVASVHREMVDVRKEVVKEQSEAVVVLEEEVQVLRRDVTDLKAALERMEGLVLRLSAAPQAVTAPSPPAPAPAPVVSPRQQQPQLPQRSTQRQVSSSQGQPQSPYSLPPILRAQTPPEAYEETFTNVLQPQHEPAFSSLVQLIKSSPTSRQEVVFPPAPVPPKLSPPVILSLAYRLAQVIAADPSPLNDEGRKQLGWLRRSLTSMDVNRLSAEVADFTPRILESVVASLHARARQLHALQDRRGLEELRAAEVYARAQLRVFAEGGARESFRH